MSEEKKEELETVITKISEDDIQRTNDLLAKGICFEKAREIVKQGVDKEKTYILIYYSIVDDEEKGFEIKSSRKEIYDTIKTMIDQIDIHKSFILTDNSGITIKQAMKDANVYLFVKNFQSIYENRKESDFDIEDYNEDY